MTAAALQRQAYRTVIQNYLVRFRVKIAALLQFFSLVHYMHNLHDITGGTLPTWCNNIMTWLLVSHCTQSAASWMKVRTSFSSRSRHLTSSFAALSITTATRGRRPTINVNVGCDEPLSQSTGCIWQRPISPETNKPFASEINYSTLNKQMHWFTQQHIFKEWVGSLDHHLVTKLIMRQGASRWARFSSAADTDWITMYIRFLQ